MRILVLLLLCACGGRDCRPTSLCPGSTSERYYSAPTLSAYICMCGNVFFGFDVSRTTPDAPLSDGDCSNVSATWTRAVKTAGGICR